MIHHPDNTRLAAEILAIEKSTRLAGYLAIMEKVTTVHTRIIIMITIVGT